MNDIEQSNAIDRFHLRTAATLVGIGALTYVFSFGPVGIVEGFCFRHGHQPSAVIQAAFAPHWFLCHKWHWYYNYYYTLFDFGQGRPGKNTLRYDLWAQFYRR